MKDFWVYFSEIYLASKEAKEIIIYWCLSLDDHKYNTLGAEMPCYPERVKTIQHTYWTLFYADFHYMTSWINFCF